MTATKNIHALANREALRQAPADDVFPARDAQAHYRTGFREAAEWITGSADALAAVATELDVIIIDKTALPETHVGDGQVDFVYGEQGHVEPIPQGIGADELIALGLALKANPPIDEAQVDALANLMAHTAGTIPDDFALLARELVAAGVRVGGDTK